jgi:hypothetical protein
MHKLESRPTASSVLLDVLDCAYEKRSWHGATLNGALRGVTAAQAALRVHGRKSVWEQLLHAAYWKHRVLTKLTGPARFPRRGSNWPRPPGRPDEAGWSADRELLRDIHRRLRAAVAALPPRRLDPKTVWLIHGAAAHDLYHAGQIKLLLRLTGSSGPA